jgi:hypothetical protein
MTDDQPAQLLLRMPSQLKAELQRAATAQGRKLTHEINMRLRESLKTNPVQGISSAPIRYSVATAATAQLAKEGGAAYHAFTELDRAMLEVFHGMPVQKQLALLSLFK